MRISRTVFATVASLSLASTVLPAQDAPRRIRFGVLAGFSMSDVTDFSTNEFLPLGISLDTKKRTAFQFGGFVTIPMSGRFSVQPEMHYIQKGTKFSVPSTVFPDEEIPAENLDFTLKLAYLEIPVLARVDFGQIGSPVQPFILAGPSISLRGSCEINAKVGGAGFNFDCGDTSDLGEGASEDPVNKFDYGAIIGGGIGMQAFGFPASVQIRYGRSFSNLFKKMEDGSGGNAKNTALSFLVGIGF